MDIEYFNQLHNLLKKNIENLRQLRYSINVDKITHAPLVSFATYSPWLDDKEFTDVYERVKNNTLVDIYRCYELWTLVRQLNNLKGDIIEVGVWRGGTAAILASAAMQSKETNLYFCDTFQGVVKAGKNDTLYKGGEHSDTSERMVEDLFKELELTGCNIYKGIFPDDFTDVFNDAQIKFLHIDVDTYRSAKEIFDYSWHKVIKGGIVVFDDYGFWGCEGVTKYYNELRLLNALKVYNMNGHGIIIKT